MIEQIINYTLDNPIRSMIVCKQDDYLLSSRDYTGERINIAEANRHSAYCLTEVASRWLSSLHSTTFTPLASNCFRSCIASR